MAGGRGAAARAGGPAVKHRGHRIELRGDAWVYSDTGAPVASDPDRPCGHCRRPNRPDGHDACLGELAAVMNACCGHGDPAGAYVQISIGGRLARALQRMWPRAE